MVSEWMEVIQFDGLGYHRLIAFESWRVAVLRYLESLHPDNIKTMERHTATDEVFILTHGHALLVLGGNGHEISQIEPVPMKTNVVYNVKRNTWHTSILSRDAHIIIVENDNTSAENSEFVNLTEAQALTIKLSGRAFLGI